MLPLLRCIVLAIDTFGDLPPSDQQAYKAAFATAFACFLCSGELTWETLSSNPVLTVSSVEFVLDGAFATIFLLSSKVDPFDLTLTRHFTAKES
ncbi:uncharacterized protein UDID_18777 [Ustilago sp. UG-2017a]|nr:uncharacterized protein UDID_18777 [Ustilago sp. UG-2017a]